MLASLVLFAAGASARGDDPPAVAFPGESKATADRLAEARKLIDAAKWSEAVEALQTLISTNGDDLAPLTPQHSIACRRLGYALLAGLPPQARKL
jgi:hypothetical protein